MFSMARKKFHGDKHKAAYLWAQRGLYVFPCQPNGKLPLIPKTKGGQGYKDATTDLAKIDKWWADCPEANIGCYPHPSGHFVLDIDDKKGKRGSDTLSMLEIDNYAIPNTWEVSTPSGGRHVWFKGGTKSSVEKLGSGLDTRGEGGYVLLPGSLVNSKPYKTISSGPAHVLSAPEWLHTELAAVDRYVEKASTKDVDISANVKRAENLLRVYVRRGDVAIEGEGANDRTYKLASELRDFGLSFEVAVSVTERLWNVHCPRPWSIPDLETIFTHAYEYAQNEIGSKGLRDPIETFSGVKGSESNSEVNSRSETSNKVPVRDSFYPRDELEQDNRPEPEWVVPGWIQEQSIVMIYGAPGSYKSFVAVEFAMSMAAGIPIFGMDYVQKPQDVVYAAGEGAIGIEKYRRPSWRSSKMIPVKQRLPFYSISEVPQIREPDNVLAFIKAIEDRGIKPGFVVLDTMSRMLAGMDENSSSDASVAVEAVDAIKRALGCTVIVLHHTGKDSTRGERGSSVFRAAFDTMFQVVADNDALSARVICTKQKDAEQPKPISIKGRKVASSLVFSKMTDEETKSETNVTSVADIQRSEIGKTLRGMQAFGLGGAVSTKILAISILNGREIEFPGAKEEEKATNNMCRALAKLSKERLAGYIVNEPGASLLWAVS